MLSTKLISCGALLFVVGLPLITCTVDESKPDLSIFNLKHVSSMKQTDTRSNRPIRDYAAGAIAMQKSLFSNEFQVRCSAYAHLLKLIRRTNFESDLVIKLDTVMDIAIITKAEREQYGELLKSYKAGQVRDIFKEAIEQLERLHTQTPASKEAWLDLTECAAQSDLNLASFLAKPRRAEQMASYKLFMSALSSRERATIEEPVSRVFSEDEISEARKRVESFDDDELKQLRAALRERNLQVSNQLGVASTQAPEVQVETENGKDEQDAPVENGKLELELTIPVEESNEKLEPSAGAVDEPLIKHKLAMMTFIKRWYQMLERTPRAALGQKRLLSVDSAIDFKNLWSQLRRLKLNPSSELGELVRSFLNDSENKRVAKRMKQIADNFTQVTETMRDMIRANNHYSSMAELDLKYRRIIQLLGQTDPLVDIHYITQAALNSRLRELNEYKAIYNFIESDSW